jgi:PKD repeat protein
MSEARRLLKPLLCLLLVAGFLGVWSPGAAADHDRIVSAVPAVQTPAPDNGEVLAFAQVGSWMVAAGTFTSVTPPGGSSLAQAYVVAFNPTTGAINTSFRPTLNGQVKTLEPGPTPGTVYLGGQFTTLNSANHSHIALLNVSNGQPVAGFKAGTTNGVVNALELTGGKLIAGGAFGTAGGVAHGGLASFNPTTGAVTAFMNQQLAERHNNSGSGAQAAVQVRAMDATPDGSRLAIIGNFRKVDGLDRVQAAMIDLSGATSVVVPDWRTNRYEPLCFSWAFDTYMRGVDFSPDGSFLVIATTGGHNTGSLCDTAARFETAASGSNIQPTWVDYSGGDTLWSVEVTERAVYVGGHQRWMNNSLAGDNNGPGSVPRPGLAVLDIQSGLPLAWNPGRNPRGEAAYALYATDAGLWLGQDTQWIGNFQYRRPRIAFFPLAGGYNQPSDAVDQLPGDVYMLGKKAPPSGNVLHRVNAGGATLGSLDAGPDWSSDTGTNNPLRNSGSNTSSYSAVGSVDASVPASTPNQVFDTERWDPSGGNEMAWSLPVTAGLPLQVRLYFANRYDGTANPGTRVFDVTLEGSTVLDNWDISAAVGHNKGTMRSFDITSDGFVNIGLLHGIENPLINAIEIVRTDQPPPGPSGLDTVNTVSFDGTTAGPLQSEGSGGITWGNVRGGFVAGGTLFHGWNDGFLYRRSFNGTTFGAATKIDPYNDPAWAGVTTGSGDTFDGALPNFYGQLNSVTGMFYDRDRVYYTLSGQSQLFWRWFNVDSGIVGADQFTAPPGTSFSGWNAAFVSGTRLYVVSSSTGALAFVNWNNGAPSGAPTVVNSPSTGGHDWRGRAMFVDGTPPAPPNNLPTANFTFSCTGLTCNFTDTSTDSDGGVVARSWTFEGGGSSTQTNPAHSFGSAGTYDVTLLVTDDDGATDSETKEVTVSEPAPGDAVSFVAETSAAVSASSATLTVPAAVQTGDRLLLLATTAITTTPPTPAGWTLLRAQVSGGMASFAWTRAADAATAGSQVVVNSGTATKISAAVVAYRDAQLGNWDSAAPGTGASRTTPIVNGGAGAWVISYWGDKASNTRTWTAPAGTTTRDVSYTSGSGNVSSLVVDSGGAVPAGPVGGLTATTDLDSTRATTWTFALLPD